MEQTQANHLPVAIDEADEGFRKFLLGSESYDSFHQAGQQAKSGWQGRLSAELWVQEVIGMVESAGTWAVANSDMVTSCHLACTIDGPALYFVRQSEGFDFDLADKLVDLNGQLVRNFNVGSVAVHQISGDEILRLARAHSLRRIYGKELDPHRPVEA
jgi:hypothetical protein